MARRPMHIVEANGRPTARQAAWAAMRRLRRWTLTELADEIRVHRDTVRSYLQALVKGGYVAATVNGRETAHYALVRDVGTEAPRVRRDGSPCTAGRGREQMWRTMRMLRDWTADELAVAASTEEQPVSDVDATDYAKHLAKAGYLTVAQAPRAGRKGRTRYRLIRNTGPKAPAIGRTKLVWDPNLAAVVWHEEIDP